MSTVFVARIGPVNVEGEEFNLYVPIADDDRALETVHGSDDRAALEQVARKCVGDDLTCAPELEAAGKVAGYRAVPYSERNARHIANVAAAMALDGVSISSDVPPLVLMAFLEQASYFWKSPVRRDWPPTQLIQIDLDGTALGHRSDESYECVILPEPALQVICFIEKGQAQLLFDLAARGSAEIQEISRFGMSFSEEPAYAIEAVKRAWGLDRLPVPFAQLGGEVAHVNGRALVSIDAAIWAVACLDPNHPKKSFELSFEVPPDTKIEVSVSPAGEVVLPDL